MPTAYKAKICGTTNVADAMLAAEQGADFFGVVIEVDFSPRSLTIDQAEPLFSAPPIPGVALVYRMTRERIETLIRRLSPHAVQFLNTVDPDMIRRLKTGYPAVELWQSIHLPRAGEAVAVQDFKKTTSSYIEAGVDALLFDTAAVSQGKMKFGGTGLTSDWDIVKKLMDAVQSPVPVWLAGGINPGNVGEALERLSPWGIDLCSGVEAGPGKKDPLKVKALMSVINQYSLTRRKIK